ncbi:hypothetical protein NC651_033197 [Populus alba x Populus x berolinensis]|nr:hypothetical protein NC651_033197 [Populus alba x Populus x berolinensis]
MKSERYTLSSKTMLKSPRNFKEKLILLPTFEEIQNPVCSEFRW